MVLASFQALINVYKHYGSKAVDLDPRSKIQNCRGNFLDPTAEPSVGCGKVFCLRIQEVFAGILDPRILDLGSWIQINCYGSKVCLNVYKRLETCQNCSTYTLAFVSCQLLHSACTLHQSLVFPYTHALLYSKNICPHLLTKFQVNKATANLTAVRTEFDHVWWIHCTLNWSVHWVWPCTSPEEHQKKILEGASIYTWSRFAVHYHPPPPPMVWSQNLRFATFCMKTWFLQCFLHGGWLTRSANLEIRRNSCNQPSENMLFAMFRLRHRGVVPLHPLLRQIII